MVPYTTTIFAQFVAVAGISMIVFVVIVMKMLFEKKLRVVSLFIPSGVPLFILPLLMPIEIISFLSRGLSLTIRLFANLTAGHILLKILATFTIMLLSAFNLYMLFVPVLFVAILLITCLELAIAVLQTYVYITLVLIYLHEATEIGH